MSADWSRLSRQQLNCILALDFAVPMHQTHLRRRYGVRGPTVRSLVAAGLVESVWLYENGGSIPILFYTLTHQGQAYQRDWKRWSKSASAKIAAITGSLPEQVAAAMNKAARQLSEAFRPAGLQ